MKTPSYAHAETHDHYKPRVRHPRLAEMDRLVEEINRLKVQDPTQGAKIYDDHVAELVRQTRMFTDTLENRQEPSHWSSAQLVVWRSSQMSPERKWQVIENRVSATDYAAYAIVNQGRWLVTCPLSPCSGAQYASFSDQFFWCVDCNNGQTGGQWIPVVWPDNIEEIEEALNLRTLTARNWDVGETIEDLVAQATAENGR